MTLLASDRRNGALRPSQRPETASARRLQDRGYYEWCAGDICPHRADCDSGKTAVAYLGERRKREKV